MLERFLDDSTSHPLILGNLKVDDKVLLYFFYIYILQ